MGGGGGTMATATSWSYGEHIDSYPRPSGRLRKPSVQRCRTYTHKARIIAWHASNFSFVQIVQIVQIFSGFFFHHHHHRHGDLTELESEFPRMGLYL